jgi:diguanylate cyclase (GGDEF)-like protein
MHPTIAELESQLNNAPDKQTRIDVLNELAWAVHLEDPEKAWGLAGQAYELASQGEFEENPYQLGWVGSLRCFAALNNDAGKYDTALQQSLRALEMLDEDRGGKTKTKILIIEVMGNISWTYRSYGDYVVAAEYAMKALKLAQEIGDRQHESGMLNILSVIYAESNDLHAALEIGQKVQQCCRELGNVRGESLALNNLAMTYLELGNGEEALKACQESLRIARENGIDRVALTVLSTMGEIYLGIHEYTNAKEYLLQALSLAREHKASPDEIECQLNLGKVYHFQQNDEDALTVLENALSLSRASNDRRGEFQCHQLLSEVYEKRGQLGDALEHYKQFHTFKETVFNENTVKRLAGLQVIHQVETAKRDAEIQYLKNIELKREIEERRSAQETLEKLASLDPLTGVLNRREFFLLGEREVQHAVQSGRSLAVLLFDIDHFKQINDSYGHAIGDQFLIHATKALSESLRQGEIIGRYGGDEFVVLLPGNNRFQGKQIAERLRKTIASQIIVTPKGDLSITLSLGIADISQSNNSTLETTLALADQALYTAKRAGRNQLAVYENTFS